MTRFLLVCASVVCAGAANAQMPRHNLGTLTCTLAASGEKQQTPPIEERAVRCAFKPAESGAELVYSGTIKSSTTTDALQGKQVLIWVVLGPADSKLEPGVLAQSYVGGTGDSSTKDASANILVGERDRDITMQPETVHGTSSPVILMMVLKVQSVPA